MDEQTQASLNRFLAMTPMGQDSHRVLATMDARQLFRAAIYSKKLYAVVADYLDHLSSYGDDEEPDSISEDGNESGYAVETDHEEVEPAPSAADATGEH
jgi:hypothetical protein